MGDSIANARGVLAVKRAEARSVKQKQQLVKRATVATPEIVERSIQPRPLYNVIPLCDTVNNVLANKEWLFTVGGIPIEVPAERYEYVLTTMTKTHKGATEKLHERGRIACLSDVVQRSRCNVFALIQRHFVCLLVLGMSDTAILKLVSLDS